MKAALKKFSKKYFSILEFKEIKINFTKIRFYITNITFYLIKRTWQAFLYYAPHFINYTLKGKISITINIIL
jgi:hypothetical protein